MFVSILVLSIFVFTRTLGYAIYEYKENGNKPAGIVIGILAICVLIGPCIVTKM